MLLEAFRKVEKGVCSAKRSVLCGRHCGRKCGTQQGICGVRIGEQNEMCISSISKDYGLMKFVNSNVIYKRMAN